MSHQPAAAAGTGVLPLPLDSGHLICLLLPCHDGSVLDLLKKERTSLIFLTHVEKLGNDVHVSREFSKNNHRLNIGGDVIHIYTP